MKGHGQTHKLFNKVKVFFFPEKIIFHFHLTKLFFSQPNIQLMTQPVTTQQQRQTGRYKCSVMSSWLSPIQKTHKLLHTGQC